MQSGLISLSKVGVVAAVGPQPDSAPEDPWRLRHAAEELVRHLSAMGGETTPLFDPEHMEGAAERSGLIVVGSPRQNSISRKLLEEAGGEFTIPTNPAGDGIALTSLSFNGQSVLMIGGSNAISTLHAVYDYLERECECGFFMDGDFIPKRGEAPIEGIDRSHAPRFEDRHFLSTYCGHFGPRKYHSLFRREQDWRQWTDWLVKRKHNLSSIFMNYSTRMSGEAPLIAYGLDGFPAAA